MLEYYKSQIAFKEYTKRNYSVKTSIIPDPRSGKATDFTNFLLASSRQAIILLLQPANDSCCKICNTYVAFKPALFVNTTPSFFNSASENIAQRM